MNRFLAILLACSVCPHSQAAPTYADVHAILAKNCLACHDAKEAEGGLVLDSYDNILAGGDSGSPIIPRDANQSLLIKLVERREKPFMPPPKKAEKLQPAEIALLRAWIDAGAPTPTAAEALAAATQPSLSALPHVAPKVAPRKSVQALAFSPKANLLAVARAADVELRSPVTRQIVRTLPAHQGNVNDLVFTADGGQLFAAAGAPGKAGEVRLWDVADGKLLHTFTGHTDAIYTIALSPDGKTFATGSYDQKIILWDLLARKPLRTLEGHNGAVFGLAFRKDGKVLASASADRTIKLWNVADGVRLDTRPESLKEQQALAFTPDGQRLFSAGVDNRIRIWRISPTAAEGTNPLEGAHFAHEGAILRLAFSADGKLLASSADDKTVKLWDATTPATLSQKLTLPVQPDWPSALAFISAKSLAVGRLDGTLAFFDTTTGKELPIPMVAAAPPKPKNPKNAKPVKPPEPNTLLTSIEPRGIQRGKPATLKLFGTGPVAIASIKTSSPKVTVELLPTAEDKEFLLAKVTAAADAPLGAVDVIATGFAAETQSQKLVIDDLPQFEAPPSSSENRAINKATLATELPSTLGGVFTARGEPAYFAFDAKSGQTIVLDAAARRVGSKAAIAIALLDSAGRTVATGEDIDGDPILQFTPTSAARYILRIIEQSGAASPEHFYRISAGDLHIVTAALPLAAAPGATVEAKLIGFNLPAPPSATSTVTAPKTGAPPDLAIPIDTTQYRIRRQPMLMAGTDTELLESEPNDTPKLAMSLPVPSAVSGSISTPHDVDLYRFPAKANQPLVLETQGSRRGSPIDTRIEILWPDGKPVQRVQLRAVRDSWLNFRPADASAPGTRLANWEEMDLNQFVYLNGEVVKLFRMPRGPDSELLFFPSNGKRRTYFDTTATTHALDDKAYIIEPHPPRDKLPPNGLPLFPINYENDDDQLRQIGPDSRLLFAAPSDGDYLVRVTDVRGFGGDRYVYRLIVRPAHPDFNISLVNVTPAVVPAPPGCGRDFTVRLDPIDGFEDLHVPIRIDLSNVPPGWIISTPIVIEPGHLEARGTIFAAADAKSQDAQSPLVKAIATATVGGVGGKQITKTLPDLPRLSVVGPALATVRLEPYSEAGATTKPTTQSATIELTPGQLTRAWLRVNRITHKDRLTFEVENLPFGVIVADIGLSGVLIAPDQSERMIFLQCAPWVKETTRLCHARANEAGNPTSAPVMVHVGSAAAAANPR